MKLIELLERIRSTKARSAWERGVKLYAEMILSYISCDQNDDMNVKTNDDLLNGAKIGGTIAIADAHFAAMRTLLLRCALPAN